MLRKMPENLYERVIVPEHKLQHLVYTYISLYKRVLYIPYPLNVIKCVGYMIVSTEIYKQEVYLSKPLAHVYIFTYLHRTISNEQNVQR